jgi:hypothetical protein
MENAEFKKRIKQYKKIIETLSVNELNEADTVFHFGNFLSDVLGYDELTDISREFAVRSSYCDFAVKIKEKIAFLVEIKAMSVQLKETHLRQVVLYAMNAGAEWCLLTNGIEFQFYHVEFTKPVDKKLVFSTNILTDDTKMTGETLWYLSRASFKKGEIKDYWNRISALSSYNLAKALLASETLSVVKRIVKKHSGANIELSKIGEAIRSLFDESLNVKISVKKVPKPKLPEPTSNKEQVNNQLSESASSNKALEIKPGNLGGVTNINGSGAKSS